MTSSRRFDRLLQAGCLGLIGTLAVAGCGGSSSNKPKGDGGPDTIIVGDAIPSAGSQLVFAPASVDFGTIDVGVKSAPVTVVVTNKGTQTGILSVATTGAGIVATGCAGTALPANGTCNLSVTAQQAVAGQFSGTIEIGDSAASTKKIPVFGVASIQGQFTLVPSPLDLGLVKAGEKATGTVVMTNTAVAGLTGIVTGVSGTGFAVGTGAGACTEALALGQSCNFIINFTAGATSGPAKGTLTVSQGGVTKTVALSATVQSLAKLSMSPASASLVATVGSSSQAIFVVTNVGDLPTTGAPVVKIDGANKDDFKAESACTTALAGNSATSCQITVTYKPTAVAATNAAAVLTVSEAGGTTVSANLSGTAGLPSTLVITGTPVDLGEVVVGNVGAASTFTVTNSGSENSGALEISTSVGQFVIVANSNNCADKDLAPKGTCTFQAQFKPAAGDVGPVNGQLKAKGATTANPAFLAVSGKAVAAALLAVTPKSLDFGRAPVLQKTAPQTLTFSNAGGAPTGALKVEKTGAQFNVEGDTCTGLSLTAAGATKTCTVTVTFTPSGTDVDAEGSIVVTDSSAPAVAVTAPLRGTGIERSKLTISPTTVCPTDDTADATCVSSPVGAKFADMAVGDASSAVTFTITNSDTTGRYTDSGALTLAFGGDAKADFAFVQHNCTAPLVADATCVVTVKFTPSAVGLRNATLTVTNAHDGIAQARLEGKGLDLVEITPVPVADKPADYGTNFGSVALGSATASERQYTVTVRGTTAADRTSTVTVALPTPVPPNFVWKDGTNACANKTLNFTVSGDSQADGYTRVAGTNYWKCSFSVQFAPKSGKGTLTADLTASASGGGSSKLTLTGDSTGPLQVYGEGGIKPAIINTPVAIGTQTDITLTVANKGSVDQKGLTFPPLAGAGAQDFQIVDTNCWGVRGVEKGHALSYDTLPAVTLASGGTCYVKLRFAPTTEAKYSVTFTVNAANGTGTADDETDSVSVIANVANTFGALQVTQAAPFADVPEGSSNATPVTFTVTNTGTVPATYIEAGNLAGEDIVAFDEFTVASGGAKPCVLKSNTFTLAGKDSCTITVQATPKTSAPSDTVNYPVKGTLTVRASFNNASVASQVSMLYNVTSNIVVKDTGASSTSISYAFPATGLLTNQKHNFVVTNIGSAAATLVPTFNPTGGAFAFDQAPTDTFDPPACKFGAGQFLAGTSCTLVVLNYNNKEAAKATATLTLRDSGKKGSAIVKLTGTTLATSTVSGPLDLATVDADHPIDLGSVPADSTTISFVGGKATVRFQAGSNSIDTAKLSFRWETKGTKAEAGVADPEFIIDSDETSCVGKVLKASETCSMNVHFKPDFVKVPGAGPRTKTLWLVNGSEDQAPVVFTATATASKSLYIEVPGTPVKDGFYTFDGSTLPGLKSDVRIFRVVNGTGADQTFILRAPEAAIAEGETNFFMAAADQQPADACVLGGVTGTTLSNTKPSCSFAVVFAPSTKSPVIMRASMTVAGTDSSAVLGLMGKVKQPVTLALSPTGTVAFDTVGVGGTVSRSFTVTNSGDVDMEASPKLALKTAVTSPSGVKFEIASGDTCNGSRLAAHTQCVFTVTATGVTSDADPQTGTLTVSTDASYTPSTLTATPSVLVKKAPALAFAPSGDFGQVEVTGSVTTTFTITNNVEGSVPTGAVTVGAIDGTDKALFSITNNTCASALEAGDECYVTVSFQPTALTAGTSDLIASFTVSATPGGSTRVDLSGNAIPALTSDKTGTAEAPYDLGSDALEVFTVTLGKGKTLPTATSPLKTSLVGSDFMIVYDTCFAKTLSVGGTSYCEVTVKYTGRTSATKKTATLTVDGGSVAKKVSVVVSASTQAEEH